MLKVSPEFGAPALDRIPGRAAGTTLRKKILVVDDDADVVDLVAFNLEAAGYSVGTAADGLEALQKARSIVPDLILLDLMLPELDGFAVCETLRQNPTTAMVPIIMLTAWSSQLGRFAGLDAGATDYVTKPFSPRELVSRVTHLLRSPGARAITTETGNARAQ
jgi:DNA-binding response OmpR family regulator